ncbi:hypothetical protein [Thermococcus aciditolerans]|nr:hypothetical protein [Thermococcus aciditolerans]
MVKMKIDLPAPKLEGKMSLEGAIDKRKSIRRYISPLKVSPFTAGVQ